MVFDFLDSIKLIGFLKIEAIAISTLANRSNFSSSVTKLRVLLEFLINPNNELNSVSLADECKSISLMELSLFALKQLSKSI